MSLLESLPLHDLEFISSGNDSDVLRGGRLVAKCYKGVDIETVKTYTDVTNFAGDHLERHAIVWVIRYTDVDSSGGLYRVNPVLGVEEYKRSPVAISKYTPGPKLDLLNLYPDNWRAEMETLDPQEQVHLEHFVTTYKGRRTAMDPSPYD